MWGCVPDAATCARYSALRSNRTVDCSLRAIAATSAFTAPIATSLVASSAG